MNSRNLWHAATIAYTGALLAACGGGGGEEDAGSGTGRLSLSITDAPIHYAQSVTVNFVGVEIKPADEPSRRFTFCVDPDIAEPIPFVVEDDNCIDSDPHIKSINLLEQTSGASVLMLDGVEVPDGRINWVRLLLADEPGRIELLSPSGDFPLTVPSGSQTGLKLNRGFDVPEDGEAHVYIDFDVRKSIVEVHSGDSPSYKLKPTLRLVEDFGAIAGEVDAGLMADCLGGSVYVFTGGDATPDDIDRDDGDPTSTTLVVTDDMGNYFYRADFLPPGDYTVAFVCADGDEPDEDDTLDFTVFPDPVTVVDDQTAEVDFQAP